MSTISLVISTILIIVLKVDGDLNCSPNFEAKGSYCLKKIPEKKTLFDQCEYCANLKAHIMTLQDVKPLRKIIKSYDFFTPRSNCLVTNGGTEAIYDAVLGFVYASEIDLYVPKLLGQAYVLPTYSLGQPSSSYMTMNKTVDGYCIENRPHSMKKFHHFVIGFEGQFIKGYHSNEEAKRFSFSVETKSKIICLLRCAENEFCSAAYFSESTKRCSHRLYMDTFLHEDDLGIAEDFQRYAIYR